MAGLLVQKPRRRWAMTVALAVCAQLGTRLAHATPGPDSVVVLSSTATESLALADHYAKIRQIPSTQRCAVQVPVGDDMGLSPMLELIVKPLQACMAKGKVTSRIEAIAVMRGLPRRVRIDSAPGQPVVSLTAALMVAQSTQADDKTPVLGQPPGYLSDCLGTPCSAAAWLNPYKKGPFYPGFATLTGAIHHRLWLATAIDGYDWADADQLAQRGALAELSVDATATWLLMKAADPARAALDWEYPQVSKGLAALGAKVATEPFALDAQGRRLAGFVTGTAGLGLTIEGNQYALGAIVDNLTSFGAVPDNFVDPQLGGVQAQVSVCRWIRAGATGAHGAVDEPLSNCFPSRQFLVDYLQGATLAEAYLRNMPYVYWKNLVLGDPMAAPYASRPVIGALCADGPLGQERSDCQLPAEATALIVHADGSGEPVAHLRAIFDDGQTVETDGDSLDLLVDLSAQHPTRSVLLVAQFAPGSGPGGLWRSKGWRTLQLSRATAPSPSPGATAQDDAASDAKPVQPDSSARARAESGCRAGGAAGGAAGDQVWLVALAAAVCWRGRRKHVRSCHSAILSSGVNRSFAPQAERGRGQPGTREIANARRDVAVRLERPLRGKCPVATATCTPHSGRFCRPRTESPLDMRCSGSS